MSFRRELVTGIGGFRIGYSCDNTELCIRLPDSDGRRRGPFRPRGDGASPHSTPRAPRFGSYSSPRLLLFERGSKRSSHASSAREPMSLSVPNVGVARSVLQAGFERFLREAGTRPRPVRRRTAGLIVAGFGSAAAGYAVGLDGRTARQDDGAGRGAGSRAGRQRWRVRGDSEQRSEPAVTAGTPSPLRVLLVTPRYPPSVEESSCTCMRSHDDSPNSASTPPCSRPTRPENCRSTSYPTAWTCAELSLAERSRLLLRSRNLRRDLAGELGCRPRSLLPHIRKPAGDARRSAVTHPICRHVSRRRPRDARDLEDGSPVRRWSVPAAPHD